MSDTVNKPAHYNQGSIECIDAMQIVLTPEEYRGFLKGNAIKYLWREETKGGIEDLRKAKWYLDRLIEHRDESPKSAEAPKQLPELPDGWRELDIGEKIRDGDKFFRGDKWLDCRFSIGDKLKKDSMLTIRRNRFEVGEKVVELTNDRTGIVKSVTEFGGPVLYVVEMQDTKNCIMLHARHFAPYIEDAT